MAQVALLALLAAAAAPAAQRPLPPGPASTPAASPASVETIVVEAGKAPVLGDLQKGTLVFNPTFFTQVRPGTAMDMVKWLPGFTFTDTRDMRGLEGAAGNVLIDGKPPNSKTDTLQSVLARIPAAQVERVDIIVGGAPGIDMHGWPVIANVVLKKGATRRGMLQVSALTDTHGNVTPTIQLSSSKNEDGRLLEYNIDVGKNWAVFPTFGYGAWTRRDATGAALIDADAKVIANGPYAVLSGAWGRPVAKGAFKINGSLRYYGTNIYETDTLTAGAGTYFITHTQTYLQAELGASYERPLSKTLTLNTQVLERPTRFTPTTVVQRPPVPSELDKNENDNETVLRATLRYKPSDKLTLESAAEGALNSADSHVTETLNGALFPLPNARVHLNEERVEIGETASWKPGPKTGFDGALKLESSHFHGQGDAPIDYTYTFLKPRLVFTWSPNKDFQLRARVEHDVGQINFGWFVAGSNLTTGEIIAGNPNLRPPRDWTGELVLERRFGNGGDLSLTFRHMDLRDVADYMPVFVAGGGVVSEAGNIGHGQEDDVIANLTLPFKEFGWKGAILKGTVTYSPTGVTDPISGRRRPLSKSLMTGELHFAQDLPDQKLNLGFDAFYTGHGVTYLPLGNQRIAAWSRVNLFVEYRANPKWTLRAEAQNLPGTRATVVNDAFAGLRGRSPLLYTDEKHLAVGPLLLLRARRTFN